MPYLYDLIEWAKLRTDKLANAAGVLAFFMSLGTWIYMVIMQRRNLRFRIIHCYDSEHLRAYFVSIENLSRLPVLISQMYLINGTEKIECRVVPNMVYEIVRKVEGVEKGRSVVKNMQIPISLPSLGGVSGYIAFEVHQETFPAPTTDANFQVHTNRGSAFQLTLSPGVLLDPDDHQTLESYKSYLQSP